MGQARRAARGWFVGLVAAAALALGGCGASDEAPDGGGASPGGRALDPAVRPAVDRAVAASVEIAEGGVLEDGPLRRRVAALAAEVAAQTSGLTTLAVLDTPRVVARGLPGGHLEVSRGLLAALGRRAGDEDRLPGEAVLVAALAATLARAEALADDHAPRLAGGEAPLTSESLARLVDGDADAAPAAATLGRLRDAGPRAARPSDDLRAEAAQAVLALDALDVPPAALVALYRRLDVAWRADPDALADAVAWHGPFAARQAAAAAAVAAERPASVLRAPREAPLGELDARALEQGALLDAAELLARRGPAARALDLVGGLGGARAAYVRGVAHRALAAAASGERAAAAERDAERALRTCLVLDAGHTRARAELGRLYVAQARREAARAELADVLRRAPLLAEVHLLLAQAEDEAERRRARLELAAALDAPGGPWAAAAEALLGQRRSPPPPPDPRRGRVFSAGSGR